MLLLLEESPFLWSPIMLSMVKPDPLEDRIVDFVIGIFDAVITFDVNSAGFDEVKHDGNGDENGLLRLGDDNSDGSVGEFSGDGLLGDFIAEEEVFKVRVDGGNPTEHGGGGGLIGKFANCAALAAAAIIGWGGMI